MTENVLYYGDNLEILQRYIKDESIDLIYLDPPFKSNQDYNVLFAEQNGSRSKAQIKVFEDTWRWDQGAAEAYHNIVEHGPEKVSLAMQAFRKFLGGSDMLAYLAMIAPRLVELRRALKPTGSIYLHCDPTASHYLKMLMDAVFEPVNFRNEIVWKRTSGHSDARRYGRVHDIILFYSRGADATWKPSYQPYEDAYVKQYYRYKDPDGRQWMSDNLSASGLSGGGYEYEWKGITRLWRCPKSKMESLEKEGRIFYTRNGIPRLKRYLDESAGLPVQDVITDLEALRSWHAERLGYPTQKPESLLERFLLSSSNEGEIVLDPFCGCGTTINVAERLKRQWIGIDVTHLAITLIKNRLRDAFGNKCKFEVIGEPVSLPDAETLAMADPYQFQWWALGLVGARPAEQKRGADRGIDGHLYFHDEAKEGETKQIILQVKGGKVSAPQLRDLLGVVERENAAIGVFISLNKPTQAMKKEVASVGFYASPGWNTKHPRLQILTIEELLNGKRIDYPAPMSTSRTFKKAPQAKTNEHEQQGLFN